MTSRVTNRHVAKNRNVRLSGPKSGNRPSKASAYEGDSRSQVNVLSQFTKASMALALAEGE